MTDLPEGLIEHEGKILFECLVCGEWTEWPADPEDFDPENPSNVCGRNERCCP